MTATRDIYSRVPTLIADFPHYVAVFLNAPPFSRPGQLEFHLETINIRRRLGTVRNAIANDEFIKSLYRTLQAWGIGARASNLIPLSDFADCLRSKSKDISEFDDLCIDDPNIDVCELSDALWDIIENLQIVTNDASIVAGTKTLHHLLPDLVVPVDRGYTQKFFGWHNPEFQYGQANVFHRSFNAFVDIGRAVDLPAFLNTGWCSSRTKVIDNAIVGMIREEQARKLTNG